MPISLSETIVEEDCEIAYVKIQVEGNTPISIPWTRGMNAQDALEAAYNQVKNSSQFSFATQFFGTYQSPPNGPLGYMVIMMNGTYDLPGQKKYWAFYLNGQLAMKGIDYTTLKPSDSIAFVNTPYDESMHSNSHLEAKHRHYMAQQEA